MAEKKLEEKITDLMYEIASSRGLISQLRSQLENAESKLINDKLDLDYYQEELRKFRARKMPVGMTEREKEIAEFKERMPDIMRKLEGEKPR